MYRQISFHCAKYTVCHCPFQYCRNWYTVHQTATRDTKQVLSVSRFVDVNTEQMDVWTAAVDNRQLQMWLFNKRLTFKFVQIRCRRADVQLHWETTGDLDSLIHFVHTNGCVLCHFICIIHCVKLWSELSLLSCMI